MGNVRFVLRKSMIVSNNTIQAARLSDSFKNLGKKDLLYQ